MRLSLKRYKVPSALMFRPSKIANLEIVGSRKPMTPHQLTSSPPLVERLDFGRVTLRGELIALAFEHHLA